MTEYANSSFDVEAYLARRPRYPDRLYSCLMEYHDQGGACGYGTLLDLGCGPGQASWPLLSSFEKVVGIDPGEKMIEQARQAYGRLVVQHGDKGKTQPLASARFELASVEAVDVLGIRPGSVDCAISGTAAHWFDMGRAYAHLATLMRSGGTVALWTYDLAYPAHHATTAEMVSRFAYEDLAVYVDPEGSTRIRSLYAELERPPEEDWKDVRHIVYPNKGKQAGYVPLLPIPSSGTFEEDDRQYYRGMAAQVKQIWDWELRTESVSSWADLAAAKRTNSSFFNWKQKHPDVKAEEDIAAQQVDKLRATVLQDRQRGIGIQHGLDDEHFDVMRPMGLLLMRRR